VTTAARLLSCLKALVESYSCRSAAARAEGRVRHSATTFDHFRRGAVLAALAALACTTCPLPAQEVYKSVDAQGHVVYSDRGSTKTAPKTTVHVDQPDPTEVTRLGKEQELLKAEDSERTKQQAIDDKNKANQDHNKQVACQNARNNYFRLKDSGRIFRRDADGNRAFYSDEEAEAMREQARRAMTAACGS
jgi:hypothetical protein